MFGWLFKKFVVTSNYIANHGYTDGSGNYYIIIDTDKCDSCGKCVDACPKGVLELITDDYDDKIASVKHEHHKNLKYVCAPCKPVSGERNLKCQDACPSKAIKHSW